MRNYIGTAWEVSDDGAIASAKTLYDALSPADGSSGKTLGEEMHDARTELKDSKESYDALWAAYQYYGDPSCRLVARR